MPYPIVVKILREATTREELWQPPLISHLPDAEPREDSPEFLQEIRADRAFRRSRVIPARRSADLKAELVNRKQGTELVNRKRKTENRECKGTAAGPSHIVHSRFPVLCCPVCHLPFFVPGSPFSVRQLGPTSSLPSARLTAKWAAGYPLRPRVSEPDGEGGFSQEEGKSQPVSSLRRRAASAARGSHRPRLA
jgi:hypothetical protein